MPASTGIMLDTLCPCIQVSQAHTCTLFLLRSDAPPSVPPHVLHVCYHRVFWLSALALVRGLKIAWSGSGVEEEQHALPRCVVFLCVLLCVLV
jgi:hypothetical protein